MGRFLRRSIASQLPVGAAALRLLNACGIAYGEGILRSAQDDDPRWMHRETGSL